MSRRTGGSKAFRPSDNRQALEGCVWGVGTNQEICGRLHHLLGHVAPVNYAGQERVVLAWVRVGHGCLEVLATDGMAGLLVQVPGELIGVSAETAWIRLNLDELVDTLTPRREASQEQYRAALGYEADPPGLRIVNGWNSTTVQVAQGPEPIAKGIMAHEGETRLEAWIRILSDAKAADPLRTPARVSASDLHTLLGWLETLHAWRNDDFDALVAWKVVSTGSSTEALYMEGDYREEMFFQAFRLLSGELMREHRAEALRLDPTSPTSDEDGAEAGESTKLTDGVRAG